MTPPHTNRPAPRRVLPRALPGSRVRWLPWAVAFATLAAGPAARAANDDPLPRTRAEVLVSLQTASQANLLLRNGEIAEPPELLQAREDFIAMQTEQLLTERRSIMAAHRDQLRLQQAQAQADAEHIARLVDEATDGIVGRSVEVDLWIEPGTPVEELVGYVEQGEQPDAATVLLVHEPVPAAD